MDICVSLHVCMNLVGSCQSGKTKAQKRSGWCRLTVFSGSQMVWWTECKAETWGYVEEGS